MNRNLPSANEIRCSCYEKDKSLVYFGKVINKYKDKKNHDFSLVIVENRGIVDTLDLTWDYTYLFEYIEINDSIKKDSGSYDVHLYRDKIDNIFTLDYNCDSKKIDNE
ncbi:MAG: hypothetical protein IPO21_07905 [Bacteroidales bacterium]|nr:hypothetical protein [Bacteroidales bacterium]